MDFDGICRDPCRSRISNSSTRLIDRAVQGTFEESPSRIQLHYLNDERPHFIRILHEYRRDPFPKDLLLREIQGLDNPTSQLLPIITHKQGGLKRHGEGRKGKGELRARLVCERVVGDKAVCERVVCERDRGEEVCVQERCVKEVCMEEMYVEEPCAKARCVRILHALQKSCVWRSCACVTRVLWDKGAWCVRELCVCVIVLPGKYSCAWKRSM